MADMALFHPLRGRRLAIRKGYQREERERIEGETERDEKQVSIAGK